MTNQGKLGHTKRSLMNFLVLHMKQQNRLTGDYKIYHSILLNFETLDSPTFIDNADTL